MGKTPFLPFILKENTHSYRKLCYWWVFGILKRRRQNNM